MKTTQASSAIADECKYQMNAPRPCPDEQWINYKHYCFKPVEEKSTWLEAQSKCGSLNSSLLIIKDASKQSFLAKSGKNETFKTIFIFKVYSHNFLKGLSLNITRETYFIGLRRVSIANDNWIWSDGNVISVIIIITII